MAVQLTPELASQRKRWVFTLNNYEEGRNYREHLAKEEHKIRRAVFGYERGAEFGTRHIQGYLELDRTYRIAHVKRILPTAHWEGAKRCAAANYDYCTKSGHFEVIGDFSQENLVNGKRPASVAIVLRGLLSKKIKPQIVASKEYADRHLYFDKAAAYIEEIQLLNTLFQKWQSKKLYLWQYQVLRMIKEQNERQVLWIVDRAGNNGKSFLSSYLNILYGYLLFDGLVSTRDIGALITASACGYCFDVSRSSLASFNYGCLESVKNGFVVSGKYRGTTRRFEIKPVVVFANNYPDLTQLSEDRWCVHTLGEGQLSDLRKEAVVSPSEIFPFEKPPSPPDLSEEFNLREYLEDHLPPLQHDQVCQRQRRPIIHTSQVPGRSRIGDESNTTLPSQAPPQLVSQDLSYVPPQLDRERRTANVGIAIRTPPTQQEVVPVAENKPMRPRICPLHPDLGM